MGDRTRLLYCLSAALLVFGWAAPAALAQRPYRVGTTAANFLELGYGSAGNAMGEAAVSVAKDLSAIYWNPAGLGYMEQSEAMFLRQPWLADIASTFAGVGLVLPDLGTLSFGFFHVDYGQEEVTNLRQQEGTGELYTANDFALVLGFSRRLTHWFSFGANVKYISSQIWHTSANAMAVDLGVMLNTRFFSVTGERENGLSIGMSISNYGSRMRYGGMDLLNPIDILPAEDGNFRDTPGQFRVEQWELPLLFRLGVSLQPVVGEHARLTLAADALHPNNNSESINLGAEYQYRLPTSGTFYLRGGYKSLFMDEPLFGLTLGGGVEWRMMHNLAVKVDYAFREVDLLGNTHSYSLGVKF
ncbi:MAG: PorV/PorQ family protein [candidate division KSB1 bacterium]|nr:PorV/PorQ family protein [candidate division KSB1 bacterium]MDZ7276257.1 PorV/PorQ family protein [candidate division KSB1 bacterium]MDZ7287937.1 PorV/PorQ family protein [candidate division KSB1 bacterium]MDZ7300050.1 PorV/PorQ family protein [candidate division KSB1 bacterium]MDZ7308748.1 PorV/PorQ family protein [candidate division KSB1 bacterium]